LLQKVAEQQTGGLFTYSIVVADNDLAESGKAVVALFAQTGGVPIRYCVQPQQNIALTRNKALANAEGDFVAFIDDDEFPASDWLLSLLNSCEKYQVAGVVGPVKRHFDDQPPSWVLKGNFYERTTYTTGTIIHWSQGRTNNTLLRSRIIPSESAFRPEFRTGEDQDFFRRMIEAGHRFVWCNEAIVYEVVPPVRWKRSFMLRRALLQGSAAVLHPDFGVRDILRSLIAIPAYALLLPFALLWAHDRFMRISIKLCDHIGKLLAVLKLNPIHEPYVTE
jgi:cellulose synthase/poly-beta-1,6-N-acetylglucosamine synthase-like glycosyltransferase